MLEDMNNKNLTDIEAAMFTIIGAKVIHKLIDIAVQYGFAKTLTITSVPIHKNILLINLAKGISILFPDFQIRLKSCASSDNDKQMLDKFIEDVAWSVLVLIEEEPCYN